MALSERFETYGSSRAKRDSVAKQRPEGRGQRPSNPAARAPPKRRHFAVDNGSTWNTSAPRAERAVKSRGFSRGAAIGAPWGRCGGSAIQLQGRGRRPTPTKGGVNAPPLEPCVFFCCEIEAAQGWDGRVSADIVIVAKCRRLGGSLPAGFQPA